MYQMRGRIKTFQEVRASTQATFMEGYILYVPRQIMQFHNVTFISYFRGFCIENHSLFEKLSS